MAVNKVQLANGTVLIDTTSVTVDAEHLASGYTALNKAGVKITGTANVDMNVTVYSGDVVNESLILEKTPANTVTGTFEFDSTAKGTAQNISLPYSGNGYPISIMVFPSDGSYNPSTDAYTRLQRYGCVIYTMNKSRQSGTYAAPTYSASNYTDCGYVLARRKASDTSATTHSTTMQMTAKVYDNDDAEESAALILKIRSKNQMSVFVADANVGFYDGIEYRYVVLYSE